MAPSTVTPTKLTSTNSKNGEADDISAEDFTAGSGTLLQRTENMFINHKIEKIKVIQRENRGTIEKKKEELRQLVGERYRDLIDAADTIVTMASSAAEVTGSVVKMQQLCNQIQHGSRLFGRREYDPAVGNPLSAVAIQMKLLMDAPEQLWSSLEEKSFYSAARIFLLARTVYTRMKIEKDEETGNNKLLNSFPILTRQWDSVHPFKDSIIRGAKDLFKDSSRDVKDYVSALAAIVLIERLSITEALEVFLEARRIASEEILNNTSTGSTFKSKICTLMKHLTKTFCDIYFIFGISTDTPGDEAQGGEDTAPGQLVKALEKAISTPFGDDIESGRVSGSHLLAQTMPAAIKEFCPTLDAPVVPLLSRQLRESSQKWLEELTDVAQEICCKLVGFVDDISGLTRARDAVWTLLDEEYQIQFAQRRLSEILSDESTAWGWLCKQTIGHEVELWKHLLEHVVSQRAQTILAGLFREAGAAAISHVVTGSQALAARDASVEASDDLTRKIWASASDKGQQHQQRKNVGLDLCGADVVAVVECFDQRLSNIIAESKPLLEHASDCTHKHLIANATAPASTLSHPKAFRRPVGFPFDKWANATEVRRFIQASCEDCIIAFKTKVDDHRTLLLNGTENRNIVDRVLFLGRVCRTITLHCTAISTMILLPAEGAKGVTMATRKRRTTARHAMPSEHEQRLQKVKDMLLTSCTDSHSVWTERYSTQLMASFNHRLNELDWLSFAIQKRTWQQHMVNEESETGEKIESKIRLPSQPSGFVLSMLCGVCAEINRVGGHTVEVHVLKQLSETLFKACVKSYMSLLSENADSTKMSQDGCLQIMLDVAFLGDVLIGATPAKDIAKNPLAIQLNTILSDAKVFIDPFDLVIFLPLIETSRNKLYFRCATLLGYLTQLHPTTGGVRPTLSSTESSNTMPMADVAPRFPLLPVGSASVKPAVRPKRTAMRGAALFAI